MNQKGQIILALILIMAVALAIGVAVIQKSLVDVATSTKVEQSQRAFGAAEAGIEKALRGSDISGGVNLENQSSATVQDTGLLPATAANGSQQDAIEEYPISKEKFAHIWLADPTSTSNPPAEFYMPASKTEITDRGIEIYWGTPGVEKAAIQIKIVYYDKTASAYKVAAYYFDPDGQRASTTEGFTNVNQENDCTSPTINTTLGTERKFYCKVKITSSSSPAFPSSDLMLVRMRLLYNSTSQPVAVRGYGTCGQDCSLPPQQRIIVSQGTSGETQRTLQVTQTYQVVPPYFDFVIFSAAEITK